MFDTLTGGRAQSDYQRLPGRLGARSDFDSLPGNFKETDRTRQNLTDAFRRLEPKLLDMGVVKVEAGSVALAKSPMTPGLTINIADDIQSNSLVEVQLTFQDGHDETIGFDAWEKPENHLSGAASVDTFVKRISARLGILILQDDSHEPEQTTTIQDRRNFDWNAWGEGSMLEPDQFLTEKFLLPNDPGLMIRQGQNIEGLTTFEVFFPGNSTNVVEVHIENDIVREGTTRKRANELRDKIDAAIRRAATPDGETQVIYFP